MWGGVSCDEVRCGVVWGGVRCDEVRLGWWEGWVG